MGDYLEKAGIIFMVSLESKITVLGKIKYCKVPQDGCIYSWTPLTISPMQLRREVIYLVEYS